MNVRMMMVGLAVAAVLLAAGEAQAVITIDTVPVGNPNVADDTGYGAVGYAYNIGKYEVTAGQYTAFLNAVAATDTYGLYSTNMWSQSVGCKIQQSNSAGSYTYSVASDYANRPVNYVGWGDAARFCNWLTNGQQANTATTEYGSYTLNGATSNADLMAVTRNTFAQGGRYYIPTEDEWYKAAYYDPNKPGAAGYWAYPTKSNEAPTAAAPPGEANSANYSNVIGNITDVGAYLQSTGPYGTFDQGGNVWEWNEAVLYQDFFSRGLRGGGYSYDRYLEAAYRDVHHHYADNETSDFGFRIAEVPEPGTLSLLALGGLVLLGRRRK